MKIRVQLIIKLVKAASSSAQMQGSDMCVCVCVCVCIMNLSGRAAPAPLVAQLSFLASLKGQFLIRCKYFDVVT
jgi:hypothetical protein